MNKSKLLILLYLTIICFNICKAENVKYFTYMNNFGSLKTSTNTINERKLCHENNTEEIIFNVLDFVSADDCECYIRLANKHNSATKKYKVFDSKGHGKVINKPTWGFVWNYVDSLNLCALRLQGENSNLHDDILDVRKLKVEIISIISGEETILKRDFIRNKVDLYDGFNVIKLVKNNGNISLYIGEKELIFLENLKDNNNNSKYGYFVGSGALVEIERFVYKAKRNKEKKLKTHWTYESINDYVKSKKDSRIIGIWHYLDRILGKENVKLGGKYSLAIVENENKGYDVLYYGGANVNNEKWNSGMLKGELIPTQFIDNYNLVWYDSMMNKINDDTYVQLNESGILSLFFPIHKSEIRFIKEK